jgi:predicted Zn-dependent protease
MINKKSKIIIGVNFLSLMVVFPASYSLAAAEFDQTFKNVVSQLSKERIPRPVVRSDDQGRELVQNINFKIFGVTKEICNQEKIEPQNCRWNIKVVRGSEFNAFATNSNQVIISSGLIDKVTYEEEIAFTLAHEIAHHLLDHIGKNRELVFIGAILGELVFGDLVAGVVLSSVVRQIGSRKYESSADAIALRILSLAGYDLKKARYVLLRMAKMDKRLTSKFMQSHPSGIERIVAFDTIVRKL